MLHIETQKRSNNLHLKFFSNKDDSGNYDLLLNKKQTNNFVKKLLNKNWDMETITEKKYVNKNITYKINLSNPGAKTDTVKKVFVKKHEDVNLNKNVNYLILEYKESIINDLDFSCKEDYHSESINTVFYFKNPNKKITVKIIDETKIEIDLVIDHERDVIFRIANELITDCGLNAFQ